MNELQFDISYNDQSESYFQPVFSSFLFSHVLKILLIVFPQLAQLHTLTTNSVCQYNYTRSTVYFSFPDLWQNPATVVQASPVSIWEVLESREQLVLVVAVTVNIFWSSNIQCQKILQIIIINLAVAIKKTDILNLFMTALPKIVYRMCPAHSFVEW